MTASPTDTPPPPRPPRLIFVTLPLLLGVFYNAFSLLTLPFSGPTLGDLLARLNERLGQSGLPPIVLTPEQVQWTLWLSFVVTALLILWLYYTRRALLEGRSWGRGSAIVIAVVSLLLFPIGTVLGALMLIGAFDRDVVAYTRR